MERRTTLLWAVIGKGSFECQILPQDCSLCHADATLVGLPPTELAKQPDETNVVCLPSLGGCNHGFAMDVPKGALYREIGKNPCR